MRTAIIPKTFFSDSRAMKNEICQNCDRKPISFYSKSKRSIWTDKTSCWFTVKSEVKSYNHIPRFILFPSKFHYIKSFLENIPFREGSRFKQVE